MQNAYYTILIYEPCNMQYVSGLFMCINQVTIKNVYLLGSTGTGNNKLIFNVRTMHLTD